MTVRVIATIFCISLSIAWLEGMTFEVSEVPVADGFDYPFGDGGYEEGVPILNGVSAVVPAGTSMAIIGHLRERFPSAVGCPDDLADRASARSISSFWMTASPALS